MTSYSTTLAHIITVCIFFLNEKNNVFFVPDVVDKAPYLWLIIFIA